MALGAILERFGAQVGAQVGAKLGRKSEKWRFQDDVKKCVVQNERTCIRMYASREGGVPYNQSIKHSTPTPWALEHSPRAQGPVADYYYYYHYYHYYYYCYYYYVASCF